MSDASEARRVYGEKEIGKILERATELQRAEPGTSPGSGMTLAELEEIAAEAGIDVRHVRRAALEMGEGRSGGSFWAPVLGDVVTLVRETTLPGEIPEEEVGDLLATIQTSVSDPGQPSVVGRTLTWHGTAPDNMRTMRALVSSRDGHTRIRIEENFSQMAGGLFGGVVGGVGGGVGFGVGLPLALNVFGSAALAVAAPVGTIALTYLGVRGAYRRIVSRRRRLIDQLFEQLVEDARSAIDRSTLEPS